MSLLLILIVVGAYFVWRRRKEATSTPSKQHSKKLNEVITDVEKNHSAATHVSSSPDNQVQLDDGYHIYTVPHERHKSLNLLRGMLAGAACDGEITNKELIEIAGWCNAQLSLYDLDSFFPLHPIERKLIDTGYINQSDKETLISGYMNPSTIRKRFDEQTSKLQFLTGLCYGMISDTKLTVFEIQALNDWLFSNEDLNGSFLYDNLLILVSKALEAGTSQAQNINVLYCFLGDLVDYRYCTNLDEQYFDALKTQCNATEFIKKDVTITIPGHSVCLSGLSAKASHDELCSIIKDCGGFYREHLSSKTDYLICFDTPDPAWTFPKYGRKFEQAMSLIQAGGKLQVVSESVFWNAVEDS